MNVVKQGHRLSLRGRNDAQLFGSTGTLRIRQLNSLNISIEPAIWPLRTSPILHHAQRLEAIFMSFRGPQALVDN